MSTGKVVMPVTFRCGGFVGRICCDKDFAVFAMVIAIITVNDFDKLVSVYFTCLIFQ